MERVKEKNKKQGKKRKYIYKVGGAVEGILTIFVPSQKISWSGDFDVI
jgi:hypothetical protein